MSGGTRSARRLVTVAVLALAAAAALAAQNTRRLPGPPSSAPERRLALVIGNDTYPEAPLRNARNDARAVAEALRGLSPAFSVALVEDATQARLADAIAQFTAELRPNDVALVYYAGHGVQVDGENYLVPLGLDVSTGVASRLRMIPVNAVQEELRRARVGILVLDACRNNPFGGTRGGVGLAPIEARGTLVAFATGAGQTASDNSAGANGLFTGALLQALREPGVTASALFKHVRQRVYEASGGQQWPAIYDDLLGDVVLRFPATGIATTPPAGARATVPDPDLARREELSFWESVKDTKSVVLLQEYLKLYPAGRYKAIAESRIAELHTAPSATKANSSAEETGSPGNPGGRPTAPPTVFAPLIESFSSSDLTGWVANRSFRLRNGVLQCEGQTRSSDCSLTTARIIAPPASITARVRLSGGCNCGTTRIRFGWNGRSAYQVGLWCDAWGRDCARLEIATVQGSDQQPVVREPLGLGCGEWYDLAVDWTSSRVSARVSRGGNVIKEIHASGQFGQYGGLQLVGYDCDGGSAFDDVRVTR